MDRGNSDAHGAFSLRIKGGSTERLVAHIRASEVRPSLTASLPTAPASLAMAPVLTTHFPFSGDIRISKLGIWVGVGSTDLGAQAARARLPMATR